MPSILPIQSACRIFTLLAVLALTTSRSFAADALPTPIANIKHDGPVDFEKEVLPILKKNCTACHNQAKAENELSLESPETILKGGASGPVAIAKQGAESQMVIRAAAVDDQQMPPAGNKVGANRLTPAELGLLKLWIDQGATGTISKGQPITWQALPTRLQPIFAVALTPDGQYAACSRGNQIFVYHVPSGRVVSRLTDPALLKSGLYDKQGVADLDFIRSLAFSPDGETLASGGFRTIKLWKRSAEMQSPAQPPFLGGKLPMPTTLAVASPDRKLLAFVQGNDVRLADIANQKLTHKLSGHAAGVTASAFSADGTKLVTASTDKTARVWQTADGKLFAVADAPAELTAAAIIGDAATLVVGAADGKCRSFAIPQAPPAADAKLPIAQEWPSPGKRVTALAAVAGNPAQIVVADDVGNVVVWNTQDVKAPVKAMQTTGGEVRALAVTPSATKIIGLEAGNKLRVWNLADGKPTAEAAGDMRAIRQVALAERNVAVAKEQVAAEKSLLADAEKVATAESEAAKKAETGKVTAEKILQEKTDKTKKAADDKATAEKTSAEAAAEAKNADEAKIAAEAAVTVAAAAEKDATDAKAAADKIKVASAAAVTANKPATAAAAKVNAAATAEAKKANDAKAAAETAVAAAEAAEKDTADAKAAAEKTKAARAALIAADKAAADAGTKAKAAAAAEVKNAEEAKAAAEAALAATTTAEKATADAKAAVEKTKAARAALIVANRVALTAGTKAKTALAAIDRTLKPLEDATKAQNEANSVLQSSARAIVSAAAASQRAAAAVPVVKTRVDQAEAAQKKLAADLEAVKIAAIGAEKPFRSLAFSPDGKLLAVGGDDFLVHTYDAETAAPLDVFAGHAGPVLGVVFTGDDRLASIGADGRALASALFPNWTWSRTIGNPASTEIVDRVTALDFSPDGKLLVSGGGAPSRGGELKIWNPADGKLVREIADAHSDAVFGVRFSPDGKTLASGAADRFLKTFDVATGKFLHGFEGHTHHVLGVSWSADGRLLATAGADNAVKSWDVDTGEQKKTIAGFTKEVTAIVFVGATHDAVACGGDQTVRMVSAATGQIGKQFAGATGYLYCCAVSGDGKTLAAGGKDGILRIWDAAVEAELKNFPPPIEQPAQR